MWRFTQNRKAEPIVVDLADATTGLDRAAEADRLAAEAEQRLVALRAGAAMQREAARQLIAELGRALSALDSAWADFDDRLAAADAPAGAQPAAF